MAHPARSAASPVSVPPAPVPVSGTASSGDHSALDGSTRVGPTPSRSGRAIRAVVGRRMAKPATVPQFAVLTDIDLEALDRVRQGLGVHSLQALVTPPEMCVPSHGAVARQPAGRNGGLTVRLQYGVRLTVDHRVADGADAARALTRLTAPLTRREIWLQAPAHPDETGRGTPSKSLCHGSGVGCSAHSVYSLLW